MAQGSALLFTMVLSLLLGGCPRPAPTPAPRPVSTSALEARLLLPPDPAAAQALAELERRSRTGDRGARWAVAHYLLDVFDLARLTGDDGARAWLWRALALPGAPQRGPAATAQVLLRLQALAEAVDAAGGEAGGSGGPAAPRGAAGAGPSAAQGKALRALVGSDRAFLASSGGLRERVGALRALRGGPLGYAAELRLYALCAQAFRAAILAPPDARPRVVNHCLYALYDVDPGPHLAQGARPPDPPWTAYRRSLEALLERVGGAGHRPAEIASRLLARERRFFGESAERLPLVVGDRVPGLPVLGRGRPWQGGAAILRLPDQLVTGGASVVRPEPRHFRVALSRLFFAHGQRTHLTLFAPADLPASALTVLLERAADTGFYTLGLGGGRPLKTRVGYWRLTEQAPMALRELPVSLAPSSEAARTLTTLTREQLGWDRECGRHGLGLIVAPGEVTAAGPDGRLSPVPADGSLATAAVTAASALHRAFPGACALWIAADPALRYGDLLAVAERLDRRDTEALRAFRYLGLLVTAPPIPASGNSFPQRVALREKARVDLARLPRRLAEGAEALKAALRPCYLDALDALPTRWARLEVTSTPEKTLVSQLRGTSPEEEKLNACVAGAVDAWRRGRAVASPLRFQVHLKP